MRFIRTTIVGGVVFLVPFVLLLMILGKAVQLTRRITVPLNSLIPGERLAGIALFDIVVVLVLLLLCFLAGLFATTAVARQVVHRLENNLLRKIPAYEVVRNVTTSLVDAEQAEGQGVLVTFDDNAQVAFEIERISGDRVVVFLPGAPNPWSGTVCIVEARRVQRLNAPMRAVVSNFRSLGRGMEALVGPAAPGETA